MKYVVVDADGNPGMLLTEEPVQEDLKAVYDGYACIFQIEADQYGAIHVRLAEVQFSEEGEYLVEWRLVT